jgi:hypothetical protein
MFVTFPTGYGSAGQAPEIAIEVEDVRQILKTSDTITVLLLNDHAGGYETFRVRLPYAEVIKKINHSKLYAASFVANDVVAAQGGSQ